MRINKILALTIGLTLSSSLALGAGSTVYETGFESSGDPSGANFTTGDLNGQGAVGSFTGWVVETGTASVVTSPFTPQSGDQYVAQDANSTIVANFSTGTTPFDRLLIKAFHNGAGAATPQLPDPPIPAAAIVAFRSIDASNYTVSAFDGNTSNFEEPSTVVQLPTDMWTEVLLSVDYTDKMWDLKINNDPYLQELGFFDDTVTGFTGFRSATNVGANLDTVGFHLSDGDFDGDGIGDSGEMRSAAGDPLNGAVFPQIGDVNGDGMTNLVDALIFFRVAASVIPAPGGSDFSEANADLNGDGNVDASDASLLYDWVIGLPSVPFIPTF